MKNRLSELALLPSLALALFAPAATGQAVRARVEPLALTGQTAPGTGTAFVGFETPFGYPDTTAPTLDEQGNAGIIAHVVDPAQPAQVTSGLWKEVGGVLRLVALRGAPAPGTGESFAGFPDPLFELPPQMAGAIAGFFATTPSTQLSLWSDRSGALELVVRHGEPLPGGPAGQSFFFPGGRFFADGSVLIESRWSNWRGDEGFWRDQGGTLALVVRAGLPAPGIPGAVFADAQSLHLEGPFDRWDTDSAGRLAFSGTVGGAHIDRTNDEGLWMESAGGGITLVLAEGNPAPALGPGFRFGVKSGVTAFGGSQRAAVRRNDAGTLFFGAAANGQGFDYVDALWRRLASGELELIAAAEQPEYGFPGTIQPTTGAPFSSFFLHVSLNAAGRVAFQDVIPHPLNTQYNRETALFWDQPGHLALVVATETSIPGLLPGELIDSLQLGELLDDGSLFASSVLKNGPRGAERALLLFAPDGSPTVLIREGQALDVSGQGTDVRVVQELGLGGFDQQRQFGLLVSFTDGSSGVFRLSAIECQPAPVVYCTAKTSSCGSLPSIGSQGAPSATAADGFVVRASGTPGTKAGLLLYTDSGRGNAPFAGGILCLNTSPLKRTVPVVDTQGTPGQCDGALAIDMNAFARGHLGGHPLPSLSIPGTLVDCQFWGRDAPGSALLSDALEYVICE